MHCLCLLLLLGEPPVQVCYDPSALLNSMCVAAGSLGLMMQFDGTGFDPAIVLSLDSQCSHILMSASMSGA